MRLTPPYNIGFRYNQYKDRLPDAEYIAMIHELHDLPLAIIHYPEQTMQYFVPALGVPSEVIVWCYNSNTAQQSRLINFYNIKPDFNKVKQPYKNPEDKRIQQRIANGSTGARMYDWFSDIQIVKNVSREKNIHPCPVPVKLMERIILLTTEEGATVFDPFMGCGTTAAACISTHRNFIGCEIDASYFNVAKDRIAQAQLRSGKL